jgi:hypothetical protein
MTIEASGQSPVAGTREQVLEEHRRIEQLARRVGDAPDIAELLRRLEEFRATIVPHFDQEEAPGGFFDLIRSRAARHLDRVRALEAEHGALLGEIDRIADQARACLAGPIAEILRQAGSLARGLSAHEARETRLLVDTLYIDIGEGG